MADITISFKDRTVFVAGGTSGINLGIAMGFARCGAKVGVLSRSQDKVDAAVKALLEAGAAQAFGYAADVRDYAKIEEAFKAAHNEYGDIDVLVSGAAGNFPAPALGMSPNAFASVINIDLLGSYHVLRAAFPHLKKPGASVINISAPQAFVPMQFQAHVCAAKAGVDMLTKTLAMEWGPIGVRVNSIVPGPIDETEGMKRLSVSPEAAKMAKKTVPLNRFGHVDDVAQVALFLSSPLASYVSGAIMPVDGGWSLAGAAASAAIATGIR